MKQTTNTLLMIRPVHFRANQDTAVDNYFQNDIDLPQEELLLRAQEEFDTFVKKLREVGVQVIVVDADASVDIPDAHFPNNWISFHENGTVGIYPMKAPSRRLERNEEVLEVLEENGFVISEIIDYSSAEADGVYLEGTGSMILDREHRKAYAALSMRTNEDLFIEFCEDFEYTPIVFTASQELNGESHPIYHTNVMMCVGSQLAIVCLASIKDKKERKTLIKQLKEDHKELIDITTQQMNQFAGNMLELKGRGDQAYLVMSTAAFMSLRPNQIEIIERYCTILHADLSTIETCGGGSARCMMAEVFLPKS